MPTEELSEKWEKETLEAISIDNCVRNFGANRNKKLSQ